MKIDYNKAIRFENPSHLVKIEIYDMQGKLLESFAGLEGNRVLWNTRYTYGTYLIIVQTKSGLLVKKFVLM